jgi:hypothetical protein
MAEVTFIRDNIAAIGQEFVPFLISSVNNSIQHTKYLLYEGPSNYKHTTCWSSGFLHIT